MKIKNGTHWSTLDLKKIFTRSINEYQKWSKEKKTNITIQVVYSRKIQGHSGYAYVNGTYTRLKLPKEGLDVLMLVRLFLHEYEHLLGYGHYETSKGIWSTDFPWASEYQVRKVEPKVVVKEKVDVRVRRNNRIAKQLDKKRAQLKRLVKRIKELEKKQKYYQKVLNGAVEPLKEAVCTM